MARTASRRGLRRLAIGSAALMAALALLAGLLWSGAARRSDDLDRLAREGGAAGDRPLAMVLRVELDALLDLLEAAGHPRPAGADLARALPAELPLDGVDLAREVDTALLLVPDGASLDGAALVLRGRFDPERIRAAMLAGETPTPGGPVLRVRRQRASDCRETLWGVAVDAGRVLVAPDAWFDALLAELDPLLASGPPRGALTALRDRAAGRRLLRASVSRLPDPGAAAADPAVPALLGLLGRGLAGARQLRVGLDRGALAGALELHAELELSDAGSARARAAALDAAGRTQGAELAALHPELAAWNEALGVRSRGSRVQLAARRSRDAAARLPELPVAALLLAAASGIAAAGDTSAGDAEIDPWPLSFVERYALEDEPGYEAGMPLGGTVDATAGPFGVRVERVARAGEALELTLRAVGPDLSNLPGGAYAPRLGVDALEDRDGAELRASRRCGPGRPGATALLERQPLAGIREAHQTLRLRADAGIDEVARVSGRVSLELPTRVERRRIAGPHTGQRLAQDDAAVDLIAVRGSGLAYRARDGATRVIDVRGLDARGRPLLPRDTWERELPGAGARVGTRVYAGGLAYVEAVFALETAAASFPFTLASARPGSDGEALHVESSSFVRYSPEQFDAEFGHDAAERWPGERRFLRTTRAGPFGVALVATTAEERIAPGLRVLAPDVPNLTYDAGGLEVAVHRIRLADGRVLTPPAGGPAWSRRVVPGYARHGRGLEGAVQLDTGIPEGVAVARIEGEIVLRLAHDVASAELPAVEPGQAASAAGVELTLIELGRDRLRVRLAGPLERLFSLRAFGADGRELALADIELEPGARAPLELEVATHGQPHRLSVQSATSRARLRRSFALDLPVEAPAAAAP